jgi:hypothetical protein
MLTTLKSWLRGGKASRKQKPVKLGLEVLEARDVPTTFTWTGYSVYHGGNHNWGNPGNWSSSEPLTYPGEMENNDVVIMSYDSADNQHPYCVMNNDETVASLTLDGTSVGFNSDLILNANLTITGNSSWIGLSSAPSNLVIGEYGSLSLVGTAASSFTWEYGNIIGAGSGGSGYDGSGVTGTGDLCVGDYFTFYVEPNGSSSPNYEPYTYIGYNTVSSRSSQTATMNFTNYYYTAGNVNLSLAGTFFNVSSKGVMNFSQSSPGSGTDGGMAEATANSGDYILNNGLVERTIGDDGTTYVNVGLPIYNSGTFKLGTNSSLKLTVDTAAPPGILSNSNDILQSSGLSPVVEMDGGSYLRASGSSGTSPQVEIDHGELNGVYNTSESHAEVEVLGANVYLEGGTYTMGQSLHYIEFYTDSNLTIDHGTVVVYAGGSTGQCSSLRASGTVNVNQNSGDSTLSVYTDTPLLTHETAVVLYGASALNVTGSGWTLSGINWNGTSWSGAGKNGNYFKLTN